MTEANPDAAMADNRPFDRTHLAEALLTSALDCIIVSDSQGRIVEFNPASERIFGRKREDVIGRPMEETIVPHHHRAAHRQGMERYLAGGQARVVGRRVEIEGMHASGHVFPLELSIVETQIAGQLYFVATLRDVSEQKRTEAELLEARASLSAIFDNIPAALYLRDLQDNLVMINSWGARFLDRDPKAMIGQPMSKFRDPLHAESVRLADARIVETRKPETHEFIYRLAGGDRVGSMTFFPVTNEKGEVTQIGGMLIDVTELYNARKEMQLAQATLQCFVEQMPIGIHINRLGPGGVNDQTVEFVNQNICKPYGLKLDNVLGRNPYSVFSNELVVQIQRDLDHKILETRKPANIEILNPYSQRHERYIRFPIVSPDGTVTHIGGTHVDVDDTVRAKAQLDEVRLLVDSIFDNIPTALYLRELDGTIRTVNKAGVMTFGQSRPEDVIGRKASEFETAAERVKSKAAQSQLLRTGVPVTVEFRRTSATGKESVVLNTIFPIRDALGKIVRIGGYANDVTELYQTRTELHAAQDLLQTIFDNVPAELYLRRLDGSYLMANHWALDFYGLTEQDLPHLTAETFDTGDGVEVSRQAQRELLATGRPVTREYHHKARGRDVVILNTIFPLRNAKGEIDRIGGVSTDITELHHARNQLRQAQESLHQSEKLAALGQLLAGIAHELNNPLAVVLGRAAILLEKLQGTPHESPLTKLHEAANRCARIVKTFLAMARQTGPRRQAVRVNNLIESALEITNYSLRASGISLNVELLPDDRRIEVDDDQLVQVLINLILNAQQALADHTGERRIDVRAGRDESAKTLTLVVADNGPGVPESIAHRIFDPFFTTKAVGSGTGLGLSVCKGMIEAHGGKLTLEATPGGGATFRITLPVEVGIGLPAGEDSRERASTRAIGRILIVDDEVEIAAILAESLSALGIESVIATDGHAALARLKEAKFDGIFCDVSMPGMDGLTFYRHLMESDPVMAQHLVFVSGDVLHRNWDQVKAVADLPVIEKPFDPQQVREAALALLAAKGVGQ